MVRLSSANKNVRGPYIIIFTFLAILCAGQVLAQEKKETKEGGADLAAKTQIPVGPLDVVL